MRLTKFVSLTLLVTTLGCSAAPDAPVGSRYRGATANDLDQGSAKTPSKGSESDEGDDIKDPVKTPSPGQVDPDPIVKEPDTGVKDPDTMIPDPKDPVTKPDPVVDPAPKDPADIFKPCTAVSLETAKKPEDFACLGSPEAIIKNIPTWLQPYFTLMHSSQSAQGATMENPRLIVPSPDGSFIFAVSTLPTAKKEIEIAVYDYKEEQWQFAGIDYSTNPPKVEKELCKTCHGLEPHTIWGSYKAWTGAYGQPDINAEMLKNVNVFKAKGAGVPEVLKVLKYKNSYSGTLWGANSGYAETETNEMMGLMMSIKAGRSLAAKVMKKASDAQIKDVLVETLCTTFQSSRSNVKSLNALQLPVEDHLYHGIAGESRRSALNVGFQSEVFFFGLVMLDKAMKADPGLKAAVPEGASFLANPAFATTLADGVTDFLPKAKAARSNWYRARDAVNGNGVQIFNRGGTSSSCSALKNYTKAN